MTYDHEDIKLNETEVIHAPTEKLQMAVCQKLKSLGKTWCTGDSYDNLTGAWYDDETCCRPQAGVSGRAGCYKDDGYTIIPAEEWLARFGKSKTEPEFVFKTTCLCYGNPFDIEQVEKELEEIMAKRNELGKKITELRRTIAAYRKAAGK